MASYSTTEYISWHLTHLSQSTFQTFQYNLQTPLSGSPSAAIHVLLNLVHNPKSTFGAVVPSVRNFVQRVQLHQENMTGEIKEAEDESR